MRTSMSLGEGFVTARGPVEIGGLESGLSEADPSQICKLEREYWDARNKYEKMCEKVALETESVEDSLMERDTLYAQMTKDEVMYNLPNFCPGV